LLSRPQNEADHYQQATEIPGDTITWRANFSFSEISRLGLVPGTVVVCLRRRLLRSQTDTSC